MSTGVMATIDQRTNLVGQNRMEMLMFRLAGKQLYGINVFKVREITQCPKLTMIPNAHRVIRGIADFRGSAIPVIDFSMAIGGPQTPDIEQSLVIISEFNNSIQALLVNSVDRIVNLNWERIKPPPAGARGASGSYLTAVTNVDDEITEIIDIERILDEVQPSFKEVSEKIKENFHEIEMSAETKEENKNKVIVIADDSAVARSQLKRCFSSLDIECLAFNDGKQALDFLKETVKNGTPISDLVHLVISDVEMPEMDGYTLATEIRFDPNLKDLYVILHTSLSGVFNEALVKKVGANNFIAKFQPDILAQEVQNVIAGNASK